MLTPPRLRLPALAFAVLVTALSPAQAEEKADPFGPLAAEYAASVRPLVQQFCLECHSSEEQEGELDLEQFATFDDVRRGTSSWAKVVGKLDSGKMPPKDEAQPSAEQRQTLRGWVDRYMHAEASLNAGDPGPVVLRRLNNAEYTYTIQDLTGVPLNPALEFPEDSASGEGFTNTGNSLVMSPSLLTKYLDAGKAIASHAVLLPDGFRFSPSTDRGDWTNDLLTQIRAIYRAHTDSSGASTVNLQGVVFETNGGGRLPVESYLAATLEARDALRAGTTTIAEVAKSRKLSPKYLTILWNALNGTDPSLLLDGVRAKWREAKPENGDALAEDIGRWQRALWRFSSVGHIGKKDGPKAWQEPITPLASQQEIRVALPVTPERKDVRLFLAAGTAGDGTDGDFVVWKNPRLVAPGRPDLPLKDVRGLVRALTKERERVIQATEKALIAADELQRSAAPVDLATLAEKHELDLQTLTSWLDYLGIGPGAPIKLDHFAEKLTKSGDYDFIQGWGRAETPNLMANSSDTHVRIPGNMKPHGVCVHPSPTLAAAVGWQSPVATRLRIAGQVTHAHPECGNGVSWSLELRRGVTRRRLAAGVAQGGQPVAVGPVESLRVQPGDLISLLIGPRDGNHSCDLTDLELTLKTVDGEPRQWSLTGDLSSDILAGNPHADRFGNPDVWHFYTEPQTDNPSAPVIPAGSLLALWNAAEDGAEKHALALRVQSLLSDGPPSGTDSQHPDAVLYRQLTSLSGPLLLPSWTEAAARGRDLQGTEPKVESTGLAPALFNDPANPEDLHAQAPLVIALHLPADLADGASFVATGMLDPVRGREGSVQLRALTSEPEHDPGLRPSPVSETTANGPWTSDNHRISHAAPILVNPGSEAAKRLNTAFERFRSIFPIALCYPKIVPVDEVITLSLYYREDENLKRLMLDDAESARLDRLWDELHFISRDPLKMVDAFLQLLEYASQDADPSVFEPLRGPINDRAAAFRKTLHAAEPRHVQALVDFASRAYRRPLTDAQSADLHRLYQTFRDEGMSHEEAFQFLLARILIAPSFLYRLETVPDSTTTAPVDDWELASRLSYFLWSSLPDAALREAAASGTLHQPEVLSSHVRRMLADPKVRRLATEFACQWIHIYKFDTLDEKSERHFPEFADLRGDMYEESIRFFTDLFQADRSVLGLFDADHTFVNDRLAKFYGLPGIDGPQWRRVEHMRERGRGGILGLSTTLAMQSGASRTSPILRGTWISEVILGEQLPAPPLDIPQLPEDETETDGLTVRELTAKHTSDPKCTGCHLKIDPYGFALEGFDPIGRSRTTDLANRPVDTRTTLPDGTPIEGLAGLRAYLIETLRETVVRQFCRKLLGYGLGRAIQLSDEPLLDTMMANLKANDYRFSAAIDTIVQGRQFREIRGKGTSRVAAKP